MRIPQGVILIWPGTNSSIPSGWTRETALDGKFPKAWGTQNPNITGGADTHSHTTQPHSHTLASHTHTYTLPGYPNMTGVIDENRSIGNTVYKAIAAWHSHSGTTGNNTTSTTSSDSFTTGAGSNIPPYYDVIFIKAGLSSILQQNIIALWGGWSGNNNPPNNWQECNGLNGSPDLRGKYLRGANTGADAGTTGGSLTHSHDLTHGHTGSSHNHGQTTSSQAQDYTEINVTGSWVIAKMEHTHTFTPGDAFVSVNNFTSTIEMSENVEPEYKKLLAIQFKTGATKAKGIIGLWLGNVTDIPKGWVLCDGNNNTPDLRDKFIKIANNSSEIGQTGGSNTHTHANYPHSHTSPSHSHTIPAQDHYGIGTLNCDSNQYQDSLRTDIHIYHNATNTDSASPNWTNSDIVFNPSDNQPPYRTVAYIQFQKETNTGALLSFFTKILQ